MCVCASERAFIVIPVANKVYFEAILLEDKHVNGRNKLFLRLPDQAAWPAAAEVAANPYEAPQMHPLMK